VRIVEIREFSAGTGEKRSNAIMDFSGMTTGFVAVMTDVIRNGKPVVGYGFSGTGRYSQNAICRERLIPRLLAADPESLLNDAGDNLDPFRAWDCMMRNEKPGGHGDRAIAVATLDMAIWDAAAKIAGAPLAEDRKRIEAVLEVLPADQLAVDANGNYGLEEALECGKALQEYGLRWFEEPGYPLDYHLQAEIAEAYDGSLATGECLLSTWDVKNLLRYGGLRPDRDLLQFDCALSYGICEYIRTIAVMEEFGWSRSSLYPHGGHLLSLHITAGLGLGGTENYPYTHQPMGGFTDGLKVENGLVGLPEIPGLGFEGKANFIRLMQENL
jgi:L-alanine-DL-glutamate epimerase-like enolase superfamily enzyme